jgi:hypothetical protein
MFWKNVILYEIYRDKLQWPNTFCTSLYQRDNQKYQRRTDYTLAKEKRAKIDLQKNNHNLVVHPVEPGKRVMHGCVYNLIEVISNEPNK